jgi:hypothetical protein
MDVLGIIADLARDAVLREGHEVGLYLVARSGFRVAKRGQAAARLTKRYGPNHGNVRRGLTPRELLYYRTGPWFP